MTRQETYDIVARALVKQGHASVSECGFPCLYRGPDGAKCAAGHLIADEDYRRHFEASIVGDGRAVDEAISKHGHDLVLVRALQSAHDRARTERFEEHYPGWLRRWVEKMRKVAAEHELSTAALDAALAEAGVT